MTKNDNMAVGASSQLKILVIDDEIGVLKSLERTLRKSYNVSVASSGIQGLQLARRIRPNLIILDIMMSGMDGYETCRELRNDPLLKSTPILFLSALGSIESKLQGFELGADDYLVKPFDIRELLYRVEAILRRVHTEAAESPEQFIQSGDLTLDCIACQATTEKGVSYLTPIEFELLYYLMTHSGQAFSASRLLQEVWDYPSDTGSPDLVRMHIRNLRHKIEPDPSSPIYIKTIPRHGYMVA